MARGDSTTATTPPSRSEAPWAPPKMAMAEAFVATEREEPEEWQYVAFLGNADLWLTAEETREVTAALNAVLERYRGRSLADRPDGTRRVRIMNMVFPHHGH